MCGRSERALEAGLGAVTAVVIVALGLFAVRRLVLVVAALLPRRAPVAAKEDPTVVILVACRNEALRIAALLASLEALEYPSDRLTTVLVDDCSGDGTGDLIDAWAGKRTNTIAVRLGESMGKATALNRALACGRVSDLVVVYDADQRPRPSSLRLLTAPFQDPRVGAASGYRKPSNANVSMVSRAAALESFAHQLVVQAGRDRLGWNPPTMGGNCVYRASALAEIGGFPDGSIGEDTEVSLALVARGWRSRFIVDSWMVVLGYADRLVLGAALMLVLAGFMNPVWPALYLTVPAAAVAVALGKAGELARTPLYFIASLVLIPFELATTATATVKSLLRRPLRW